MHEGVKFLFLKNPENFPRVVQLGKPPTTEGPKNFWSFVFKF